MTSDCERLDAFLCDELDSAAAAAFEAHLAKCAACREALAQQQWIDALLRSTARAELEPPPETLIKSLPTTTTQRRRRARLIACGLATAATLLLAAGWFVLRDRATSQIEAPQTSAIALNADAAESTDAPSVDGASASEIVAELEPPRATFVSSGDAIAVPLENPAPDVTVMQLYPTTDTERRWRRELALQTTYLEPNGG